MESTSIKKFYTRRFIKLIFIASICLLILSLLSKDVKLVITALFILCICIFKYNMLYIAIGENYISVTQRPFKEPIKILFNEVISVKYEANKIVLYYCNSINRYETTFTIYLGQLENKAKNELIKTLQTNLEGKQR
ncbi:hypothetical protein A9G11_03220 [Gilliamella sp. wkB108]|uniref:hypothetical protein n=1 Tax=Gilliamella sp. wkB108 TaxID=3120256 RepID=UPI00080DA068|nr:hypothetical protein [Gilliamella apicola]OCG24677.1 hypothetical protein A9G11_03220 [Gilliamella apicola]